MADVFISFIHEESSVAEAVARLIDVRMQRITFSGAGLVEGGTRTTFLSSDREQLQPGEVWLDRIKRELTNAAVIVSLLSPRSITRPWINFEAGAAWLAGKVIIPTCFGGLQKENLPKPYSDFQIIELKTEHRSLTKAVAHWIGITERLMAHMTVDERRYILRWSKELQFALDKYYLS